MEIDNGKMAKGVWFGRENKTTRNKEEKKSGELAYILLFPIIIIIIIITIIVVWFDSFFTQPVVCNMIDIQNKNEQCRTGIHLIYQ